MTRHTDTDGPVNVTDLIRVISYNPETGDLVWRPRDASFFSNAGNGGAAGAAARWNGQNAGRKAFPANDTKGYRSGKVLGRCVLAHRVAWAITHGKWPERFIDHINGDRSDNRLVNLREATRSQNAMNAPKKSSNSSGVKGVDFEKQSKTWRARIGVGRRRICLGRHATLEGAAAAYAAAVARYHGEFGRVS